MKQEPATSDHSLPTNMAVLDTKPTLEAFSEHVHRGLAGFPKYLASKFLYDERGSELFNKICAQPEYYQTNAEMEILRNFGDQMVKHRGRLILVEFGSGNSRKIQNILGYLKPGSVYVPLDISRDYLVKQAADMALSYPSLLVKAVCADFLNPLQLPVDVGPEDQVVVFFPGSTIGNFEPETQKRILTNLGEAIGSKGFILIGVDRKNDVSILEAAYNDAAGVTAAFELNILTRMNRELGANFNPAQFTYQGIYNPAFGRVEMYLVSNVEQQVQVEDRTYQFGEGERIHVENSYKYTPQEFQEFVAKVGLEVLERWSDSEDRFSVYRLGHKSV